jgi:hypothetical protein
LRPYTVKCTHFHNEEPHTLYPLAYIIRVITPRTMSCGKHGEMKNAYKISVGKSEVKRLLRRPRREGEDSIKSDFNELGYEVVHWIHFTRDRGQWLGLVKTEMTINIKVLWDVMPQRGARDILSWRPILLFWL